MVSISGGLSSYYMLRYAAEQYEALHGVFADVRFEDPDTYRVVTMCAQALADRGEPLTVLCDGRNPFDVFDDVKLLGNTRKDPCSANLKRKLIKTWLKRTYTPDNCVMAIGYDVDEAHRIERTAGFYDPFPVATPLADAGVWSETLPERFEAEHGWLPWAYRHHLPHSNCYGMCVKAGIEQWLILLRERPEVYAYAEAREEAWRAKNGPNAILRDRTTDLFGDDFRPLSLRELRAKAGDQATISAFIAADEGGSCSCFDPPLTDVEIRRSVVR